MQQPTFATKNILIIFAAIAATLVVGGVAFALDPAPVTQADSTGYQKDQCKKNGWKALGFKNQGQCVSFFASGGRGSDGSLTPPTQPYIRIITLECTTDNSEDKNRLAEIVVYNPTGKDVDASGWTLRNADGILLTYPNKTFFDAYDGFDLEPDLPANKGLNYAGDHLALYDKAGNKIDSVNWGTDTSGDLTPPLDAFVEGKGISLVAPIYGNDNESEWDQNAVSGCN